MIAPDAYLDHLRADGMALADAVESNPKAPVPSMPGYDTGALLIHTGGVHRWFIACIHAGEYVDGEGQPPPPADFVTWFREGVDELSNLLSKKGPDAPTWTWGSEQSTGFWLRRAAQETSVHRWDGQNAVGAADAIEPELAVDGVDELFDEFGAGIDGFTGDGETVHLHATDADGEWLLTLRPDGFDVTREHAKGDVAARGPASDLLLMLWGRVPVDDVETFGDAGLLERWQRDVNI